MGDHEASPKGGTLINNVTYDVLDKLVKIGIPGVTAFYAALATVWGWGYAIEVATTGVALTALGGVFLQIATNVYNKSEKKIVDAVNTLRDEGAVITQPHGDSQ
jgi:hypothetical protein